MSPVADTGGGGGGGGGQFYHIWSCLTKTDREYNPQPPPLSAIMWLIVSYTEFMSCMNLIETLYYARACTCAASEHSGGEYEVLEAEQQDFMNEGAQDNSGKHAILPYVL